MGTSPGGFAAYKPPPSGLSPELPHSDAGLGCAVGVGGACTLRGGLHFMEGVSM